MSISIAALDLNLLLVLHTVLTERSVVRAAERLHVTPSAISNSLARLRSVVGDPLVTRKGRGIVPTPRALALAPAIARGLRELESGLQEAPFEPARCTRTFTLAVADAGQVTWGPRIAARMAGEMPNARLSVVGIASLVALGDLTSSQVDLHIGLAGRGAGLHIEPLLDERTVLVARDHPGLTKRLSARALGALRHVGVEMVPGKGFRDLVGAAYARAGIRREVAMTVPSFLTAAAIVAATDLVVTLPASLVAAQGARLGVRCVNAPVPAHTVKMALCWHDRTHADPAARYFRELVRLAVLAA
ncbi:LysR family transcriptional regulator [Corallococcus exiguus]|uniref:LysR family transcriptional regulator n=1 Tax=Corallococcus TaxID=83461 RepID=UPI000EE9C593|nr:LysR family transcriptional regulator [Corallococcus sp. AB032C]NNC02203.1 LysR family transcriptional regulator [Corallococcus exiguus]NPC46674.1 LysR family transcriptional regulator [Corallococcus exiguus]RKH81839.1 LysR family transcriptional regulator [Corallococcus sp. AB032C]